MNVSPWTVISGSIQIGTKVRTAGCVARAASAARELSKGLKDGSRIDTEGRGANEPLVKETDATAKAQNRRIEIFVPLREGE